MENPHTSRGQDATASVEDLIALLNSDDYVGRQAARAALVARGEAAVPALSAALRARAWLVRWESAKALSQMRAPSSAPALVRALEDVRFGVRWLAAEGLINLGAEGLPPLLNALLADPGSARLREGAHHVLKVLTDGDLRELVANVVAALEAVESEAEIMVRARAAREELSRSHNKLRSRHPAPGRTRP